MEDNIDRIKGELEEARQSLHETVAEVNRKVETVTQKVETVTQQLQPAHLVERNPLLSACVAAALGFALGNRGKGPLPMLILGGLLGAILSEAWNDGFRNHNTTVSA